MERFVGKKAPFFKMKAVTGDGEQFIDISLEDYKGKWLILFFYPLDFTFVCPTEITGFSEYYKKFQALNAEILAVSLDSEYSHQAWIRNGLGKIAFPMASDKTMQTASDYGVLIEEEGIALRGLFIIDDTQTIRYSVIHDLNVGRSMEETLRVLSALQTKKLCGANWTVGSQTLDESSASETAFTPSIHETVAIYTMPGCTYCKGVKEFLKKNGVSYREIHLDTDTEGQAFMEERGYTALPVTVINGQEISGYQIEKIKEALSK